MALTLADLLADRIELEATIDGKEFLDWSSLTYTAQINKPRTLSFTVLGKEEAAKCRLGGKISVEAGRGGQTHNLSFKGIIKIIKPTEAGAAVMAMDYTTHLQSSAAKEYKEADVIGQDLYYLAAAECDYKGIDVSQLKEGSGLVVKEDMISVLTGVMSRKTFIDACFGYMYQRYEDANHEKLTFAPWRYGILSDDIMSFWLDDFHHYHTKPGIRITETDDSLTGSGVVAQIDTTKVVNNATFVNAADTTMHETYTDAHSEELYGPSGFVLAVNTENRDRLRELAREYVSRYSTPTITYNITLSDAEWVGLGELVQVSLPQLKREDILPVVGYETTIADTITTRLTLGEPELTPAEIIKRLS